MVECGAKAAGCTYIQCRRGCSFVVDRLVEGEGNRVLACIEASTDSCGDQAWARCAVRIGPHADGGPPAPEPTEIDPY